ncbi:YciI family protein [Caballeronia sordidicola]|uniref:YciI family protein n=1 Tax=Caballeronia sordidicola TaxID=196367 RepID=UPI000A3C4E6E|nr:YciI family protein [Caballeronia sordidicola]
MYFVIHYRAREENAGLVGNYHAAHREFRKSLGSRVLLAGPLLAADGGTPVGSLFIVAADNLEAASEIASEDPLCKHEIFDVVSVAPFKAMTFNAPEA